MANTTIPCKNCKKKIKQTPKKRQKEFCNSTCRSNYWAKKKRKEKKRVKKIPLPAGYVQIKNLATIDASGKVKKLKLPGSFSPEDLPAINHAAYMQVAPGNYKHYLSIAKEGVIDPPAFKGIVLKDKKLTERQKDMVIAKIKK